MLPSIRSRRERDPFGILFVFDQNVWNPERRTDRIQKRWPDHFLEEHIAEGFVVFVLAVPRTVAIRGRGIMIWVRSTNLFSNPV